MESLRFFLERFARSVRNGPWKHRRLSNRRLETRPPVIQKKKNRRNDTSGFLTSSRLLLYYIFNIPDTLSLSLSHCDLSSTTHVPAAATAASLLLRALAVLSAAAIASLLIAGAGIATILFITRQSTSKGGGWGDLGSGGHPGPVATLMSAAGARPSNELAPEDEDPRALAFTTLQELAKSCKTFEDEVVRGGGRREDLLERVAQFDQSLEQAVERVSGSGSAPSRTTSDLSREGSASTCGSQDADNDDEQVIRRYFSSTKIFGNSLKSRSLMF